MEAYPKLSLEQVRELLKILKAEQLIFALVNPSQQAQLGEMVRRVWETAALTDNKGTSD